MIPYQYVVLRCVPRVDRGETINVGIVLYAQATDALLCAGHVDDARLRALAPTLDPNAVRASLDIVADVCAGRNGGGRPDLESLGRRFGWLSAPRSTVVQPGPVHGGLTRDPTAEVERLLELLVR